MSPLVRIGRPELGNTGQEMYDNTSAAAWADADNGYAWANFLSALSYLLDPIADVTRPPDGSERWTTLASPSRVPDAWLPVLAQWAGVRRPESMTLDELRALIGPTSPGMWRGTRAGILAAVRRFMPEDAYLYWEEKADGNPYKFRVFTFNTDADTEARIREALAFEKPAGLFPFEYEVRVGQTWRMHYDCGYTWWQTLNCFESWYDVLTQEPEVCRDCPPTPEPPPPPEGASDYDMLVLSRAPLHYWPLDDPVVTDGSPARDLAGDLPGAYDFMVESGPGMGDGNAAAVFGGAGSMGWWAGTRPVVPDTFTVEIWARIDAERPLLWQTRRPTLRSDNSGALAGMWAVTFPDWVGNIVGSALALDEWRYFVVTYDGEDFVYYENAVEVDRSARPGDFRPDDVLFQVGTLTGSAAKHALHGRALTVTEIEEHYRASGRELERAT